MSAWSGWIGDMIAGLGIPDTGDNKNFLTDWALYDPSTCRFNPLIASHKATGSTNCRKLNSLNTAQAYQSHADAVTATRQQLNSGGYPDLHAALHSGDPIGYNPLTSVALDLQKWGAIGWQQKIIQDNNLAGAAFGSPAPAQAAAAWSRWMRGLAHNGPDAHRRIKRATARVNRIAR